MWINVIEVAEKERALLYVNGRARKYLRPGRHWIVRPFQSVKVVRLNVTSLVADLEGEALALVPSSELAQVEVAETERAVLYRNGRPVKWLPTGLHQIWTVERNRNGPAVEVKRLDVSGVEVAPLPETLRTLVPASEYQETVAPAGAVMLRYVNGELEAVLPAGRHAAWSVVRKVQLAVIDLRERLLNVPGQDVMTQDRVSVRLNLAATFEVKDARRLATVARDADEVLYLAMQLATREAVGARTLDALLADREKLAEEVYGDISRRAEVLGLALTRFGIKDIILPGEMKSLLNRVIEAQKAAEANVIFRREETAATRSMAQTAKVLAENPLLVRLKELEAYKDLAQKVGTIHLVLGEGGLPTLQLKA